MLRREFARTLFGLPLSTLLPSGLYTPPEEPRPLPQGGSITDVPGLKVGHYTLKERPTGCTVMLCEAGATAGVDVRGSAPGTRETDLLSPINSVQQVNAILLSGGSAYGLDAASGVMRYLEEKKSGVHIGQLGVVPIVPAAILMDLGVGDFHIRPNAAGIGRKGGKLGHGPNDRGARVMCPVRAATSVRARTLREPTFARCGMIGPATHGRGRRTA